MAGSVLALQIAVAWFRGLGGELHWLFVLLVAVDVSVLGAMITFPLWGGQRITLRGGVFALSRRRSTLLELPLREITRFAAVSSEGGYNVYAVTHDAEHLLDLDFRNVVFTTAGNSDTALASRNDDRAQAEFIAARLDELLLESRRATSYRQ